MLYKTNLVLLLVLAKIKSGYPAICFFTRLAEASNRTRIEYLFSNTY